MGEFGTERRGIEIRTPLKEVAGKVYKGGRQRPPTRRGNTRSEKGGTKTPAGSRFVALPPGVAVLYEELMGSHREPFGLCTPEGHPWRRSNFRIRFWRPAWDGDESGAGERRPPILPTFTFHEGRHTHATWLTEDGIPEVARRARLGQKMEGIARVYDHVMVNQILDVLQERWPRSPAALYPLGAGRAGAHLRSRRAVPVPGAVAI
ncbi:integrase [Amycolatopsis sp. OK19-0408]|uniref:Integrase n=1 Tax=Amycolatopsis iheyensis TaxID=2945988 RepID=A0A9X2SQE6_9PSEU|nr:integrase [Amycolatopsis iheyensis]MCR6489221.1 integrase [Amycolatopsis iheyensis]